jgi:hypothetical protein
MTVSVSSFEDVMPLQRRVLAWSNGTYDLHSSLPILYQRISSRNLSIFNQLTWIPSLTVRANIVPRHTFNQILQRPLIARLLAFAQSRRHFKEIRLAG